MRWKLPHQFQLLCPLWIPSGTVYPVGEGQTGGPCWSHLPPSPRTKCEPTESHKFEFLARLRHLSNEM